MTNSLNSIHIVIVLESNRSPQPQLCPFCVELPERSTQVQGACGVVHVEELQETVSCRSADFLTSSAMVRLIYLI
jgi:hypothetical protein